MKHYLVTIDTNQKNVVEKEFVEWILSKEHISIQRYFTENDVKNTLADIVEQVKEKLINEFDYKVNDYRGKVLEKWHQPTDDYGLYWTIVTMNFSNIDFDEEDSPNSVVGTIHAYKDLDCGGYGGQKSIKMKKRWFENCDVFLKKFNEKINPLINQGRFQSDNDNESHNSDESRSNDSQSSNNSFEHF